ncbi:MAG: hypothetical protein JO040_13480 [Gemmatimonadetes bacterium]|nr:hypothetical protein [Gemmatimonadota bacterium]
MTADREEGTADRTDAPAGDRTGDRSGDRRGTDRRGGSRRQQDRRSPPPVWRRPWALVSYGVLGALVLVLLVNGLRHDDNPAAQGAVVNAPPVSPNTTAPSKAATAAPIEDAYGAAGYERLTIQGQSAVGRRVRTELFCDAPTTVALRLDVEVESAIAALRDAEGRVPGALCQWGTRGDARREDFLLLIPAPLASAFAAAPVTTDDFVRRRRLVAEVEWVGTSQALALRTAGVLRRVYPR